MNLVEDVIVSTVDEVVKEVGISRIDLLKIDVEGFEPDVLKVASIRLPLVLSILSNLSLVEPILIRIRIFRTCFTFLRSMEWH